MRRKDREMDRDFALAVADKCEYANIAMADKNGMPYCVPVTIARSEDRIYFHSALEGRKTKYSKKTPRCVLHASATLTA